MRYRNIVNGGDILGVDIKIITHFPDSIEDQCELARRIAAIHADAVESCVNNLTCPYEQKQQLIDSIIVAFNSKGTFFDNKRQKK